MVKLSKPTHTHEVDGLGVYDYQYTEYLDVDDILT